MQLSPSLQTLTGADEPQSMIVMSYRSPWENRGTERGEVGRGGGWGVGGKEPEDTRTFTGAGGLPREEREKLKMNHMEEHDYRQNINSSFRTL